MSPAAELAAANAAVAQAAAAASVAAAQAAAASAGAGPVDASAPAPVLGEVKRFSDKEKPASGSTKILLDASKIFNEPDVSKPSVVSLSKDLIVTRLANLDGGWTLIEFPSGVGKVSPGWIESKSLVGGAGVASVASVASAAASAKPASSATPAASASAKPAASGSAKPAATAAASAVPAPTASASVAVKPKFKPGAILHAPAPR